MLFFIQKYRFSMARDIADDLSLFDISQYLFIIFKYQFFYLFFFLIVFFFVFLFSYSFQFAIATIMPANVASIWNFSNCPDVCRVVCAPIVDTRQRVATVIIAKRVSIGIPASHWIIGECVKVSTTRNSKHHYFYIKKWQQQRRPNNEINCQTN